MDIEFYDLFSFIENTIKKQEQQKLRGLNDYNMVNVVRKASLEVGMHSNVLYSLLDPNGLHYQGALFLSLFIDKVLGLNPDDFGEYIEVCAEEPTLKNRRIDFTIKSNSCYIGIEMKVNAADQKNQIKDYYEHLIEEAKKDNNQQVQIYYLTKYGSPPSTYSTGEKKIDVKLISFKKHIINWLNDCQYEIRNISNLNLAFENYKDIVKKITKQYKGNVMTVSEELSKPSSKNRLRTALRLDKEMKKIRGNALFSFFEQVKKMLGQEGHKDISSSVNKQNHIATEKTCEKWFVTSKSVERNIGLFFDCGFRNSQYLFIEVATEHLHFGVVTCNFINDQYVLTDTLKNPELDSLLTYQKWRSFINWYSNDCGNIRSLSDPAINQLLDFENSKLKTDIIILINKIKTQP